MSAVPRPTEADMARTDADLTALHNAPYGPGMTEAVVKELATVALPAWHRRAVYAEAQAAFIQCAGCGDQLAKDDPDLAAKAAAHLVVCEKHPMRAVLGELAALRTAVELAASAAGRDWLDQQRKLADALTHSADLGKDVMDWVTKAQAGLLAIRQWTENALIDPRSQSAIQGIVDDLLP